MEAKATINPQTNGNADSKAASGRTLDELLPEMVRLQVPINGRGVLPTNMVESWSSYFLQLMVPGIDIKSLTVQVVAQHVTVTGKYDIPTIDGGSYVRRQLPTGYFSETFQLPEEVDEGKAVARYDRGILTIELPKVSYLRPTKVAVEVVG